jgi:hypothetical protein
MTEETTEATATEETKNNNINISIEQICAAILAVTESVEVPLEKLVTDYSNKSIAVNQDPETKTVTFTLVDNPAKVEETEQVAE